MANNKVQLSDGTVLIDVSNDTVSEDNLLEGKVATNASGVKIRGSLVVQRYYTGSATPSSSLGNDGDLYLIV